MTTQSSIDLPLSLVAVLPLAPLIGSFFSYLSSLNTRPCSRLSGYVASFWSSLAFVIALLLLVATSDVVSLHASLGQWIAVGDINVDMGFRFDRLAAVMSLVITGVGTLIHFYAIGYMEGDEDKPRFFAYLNLFLFAMLVLVLADNLVTMFVGWEGVGLCSYLLIGFWYKHMPNAVAGQKAFVVNRIGDAGFLLGMFTLLFAAHTLSFAELPTSLHNVSPYVLEAAAALLFVGAIGKSAQFPLYVWLPDAMAGPTPVSALIHAATMVTAGVYMIARMHFLYDLAPHTLAVVLGVGTFTAFFAATIALVQTDIKKVLAYSTVSQLGFMFMALGSGAYSNGIFHVVTHAFFKACLFMCAGSVIIGCHHEQDMRHFGGLWKKMPVTFACYAVAVLAIAGVPMSSGALSKDEILFSVLSAPGLSQEIFIFGFTMANFCWAIGVLTAGLTAIYMTRSLVLTFFGNYRGHAEVHESRAIVTIPLVILALLSAFFGLFFHRQFFGFVFSWTRPDLFRMLQGLEERELAEWAEEIVSVLAVTCLIVTGIALTFWSRSLSAILANLPTFRRALENKWWVDEIYGVLILRPLKTFALVLFLFVDRIIIDGTANGAAALLRAGALGVGKLHTGRLHDYLAWMLICAVVLALCFLALQSGGYGHV